MKQLTLGNQVFNEQQLRALFQAICVEENTEITGIFAVMALEDGVDIVNDMAKEPDMVGTTIGAGDVRHQAHMLVESGLQSFATDVNEQIANTPVTVDVKVVVTATARIG